MKLNYIRESKLECSSDEERYEEIKR